MHRFRYAPASLETLTHDQTTPDRIRERPHYLALLPGYLIAGTLAAIRLARSGRFDAVHAFWPLPHGLFGLAARRVSGIPLISTFFGVELTWLRRQLPFLAPVVRFIVRRSDAVTVISTQTGEEVRALVPEARARTIPFGAAVAATEFPFAPYRAEHPFRLLFVGRLVERKGVEVLLRALALLEGHTDLRLTVVGDGPLRASLEQSARRLGVEERVEFAGFVPAEELSRRFDSCDAFVLPAVQDAKGDVEGLGVVLIEALLHGKPVIASDSGGIGDIVRDGESGLLVPPGDPQALADAILRLRSDPSLAERLVREGREHVRRHFSWEVIVGELANLYRAIIGSVRESVAPDAPIG